MPPAKRVFNSQSASQPCAAVSPSPARSDRGWCELALLSLQPWGSRTFPHPLNLWVFPDGTSSLLEAGPAPQTRSWVFLRVASFNYTTELSELFHSCSFTYLPQTAGHDVFPGFLLSSWELRPGERRGLLWRARGRARRALAPWPHPCSGSSLMFPWAVHPCDKWHLANHVKLRICWYESSGLMGGGGEEEASWLTRRTSKKNLFSSAANTCKRAVQGSWGSAELPPPLFLQFHGRCCCESQMMTYWCNILVALPSFPSTVQVIWEYWRWPLPAQPEDGPLWSHHSRKLRFFNNMLKSHYYTVNLWGPLCVFSDSHDSSGWQIQGSPGPQTMASFSWVFVGEGCWRRGGKWSQLREWGVWDCCNEKWVKMAAGNRFLI